MEIRNLNSSQENTSFKGLWGNKTYMKTPPKFNGCTVEVIKNGLPVPIVLNQIDKFYPFADDTKDIIEKEIKEGLKNGVKDRDGYIIPFSEPGKVEIKEALPFTRAEFEAYKTKNLQSKSILLSEAEKEIEYFLDRLMLGLISHKNQYTPAKALKLVDRFKLLLHK